MTDVNISQEDLVLFQYLYDYKSLSVQQCWQAAFQARYPDAPGRCFREELQPLINSQMVRLDTSSFYQYRLSLTNLGIDALRESKGLPRYDENGKRNFKLPKDLAIEDMIVPHQLSLNQFLLDFRDWMNACGNPVEYEIQVEKLDEKYDWFRPDAVITMYTPQEPIHLYIEQDMGNEEKKPLMRKWDRYQKYIAARKGERGFGRMVMLFIINFDTSVAAPHNLNFDDFDHCIEYRKRELFRSIPFLFPDMLDGFFDVYMGTEEDALKAVFYRILNEGLYGKNYYQTEFVQRHPSYQRYKFSDASPFFEDFGRVLFDSYVRLLHNGKLVPGTACVCDNAEFLPLSVFAKTKHMDRVNAYFAGSHRGAPELKYLMCNCNKKDKYLEYCSDMGIDTDNVILK